MDFPLPSVHLNGTSREELLHGYQVALSALVQARQAMAETVCHGRDYYVQHSMAYTEARIKREEMFLKLQAVEDYLRLHVQHLTA